MSEFEEVNFFTDRSVQDDPYSYFDWVRAQSPVWREPHYGLFMITGHEEAMAIYERPGGVPPTTRRRAPGRPAMWSAGRS